MSERECEGEIEWRLHRREEKELQERVLLLMRNYVGFLIFKYICIYIARFLSRNLRRVLNLNWEL